MSAPAPAPAPKFRDSAAVVLIRGHGKALEVYWVRRSDAVAFMPGFYAFVGGTVDAADADLPFADVPDDAPAHARACAIREALEETGVLLGLGSATPSSAEREELRRRLLAGQERLIDVARSRGWKFRAADLEPAGRWTTPPFAARRFDTLYFLARVPPGQDASIQPGELAMGEWIAPARALERWREGEVTFVAPILRTLEELALGEQDLAVRLVSAPERAGQPVRRIEPQWGVVLQPMKTRPLPPATHTNAYLVGEGEMVMIDPGGGDPAEVEALTSLIDTLARDGRRLKCVVVTHDHPDHIGALAAVRERYRVPVGAHPLTAPAIGADFTLSDGDTIALATPGRDWTLRALHTPGHTRGHLCLLHERTRSLFTGDHIPGGGGTVIIDPPDGDMTQYLASLERLLREPVETLFPGHGSPQGAAERRIRGLIRHRREREAKVLAALDAEPRTLEELVERAYADTARELWKYAERSLLAHLLDLESRGAAARDGERWRRST